MKRNVHQKLTFVGIRALAFRYSEAKPWHNALLRHSGNLNNDKNPKIKGPDVWLAMML